MMQIKNKLFCTFNGFNSLPEKIFVNSETIFRSVSLTHEDKELMIFIEFDVYDDCYKVTIYKDCPSNKYISNKADNALGYRDSEEYTIIYFANFDLVKTFIKALGYNHPEFQSRPYRKIQNA